MTVTLPPFLQELLDRGSDPLTDEQAQQWLLEHPDALEAFAATRSAMTALRAGPRVVPPWQRALPRLVALTAAALALAALFTFASAPSGSLPQPRTGPLPRPDFAPMTLVAWRVTTSEVAGDSARERVLSGSSLRTSDHYLCLPTPGVRHIAARIVETRTLAP